MLFHGYRPWVIINKASSYKLLFHITCIFDDVFKRPFFTLYVFQCFLFSIDFYKSLLSFTNRFESLLQPCASVDVHRQFMLKHLFQSHARYACQSAEIGQNWLSPRHHLFPLIKCYQMSLCATFKSIGNYR